MKLIYLFLFLPFVTQAFQVDSMIKIADKEDYFIVTGNDQRREYVYITLSELISSNGSKPQEISYDASNVTAWPVVAEPSELVISSGEQVKVKINKNYGLSGNDRVFGVTFTPDIINARKENDVNIPFGYKAWFIIPGQDALKGDITVTKGRNPGEYFVHNKTNKVLDVRINTCPKGERGKCKSKLITRPWSSKKVNLDKKAVNAEFEFFSLTGDSKEVIKRIIF